jgi:hypothetical protein
MNQTMPFLPMSQKASPHEDAYSVVDTWTLKCRICGAEFEIHAVDGKWQHLQAGHVHEDYGRPTRFEVTKWCRHTRDPHLLHRDEGLALGGAE